MMLGMTPIKLTKEQRELLLGLPPPRKKDILFRSDPDDIGANASLNFPDSEFLYSKGYRTAAKLLSKQVFESAGTDKNVLVFPILYLYRHYIELLLKRLTEVGAFLADKELSKDETISLGRHRLDVLWDNLLPILEAVCDGSDTLTRDDIEGVHSYVRQMTCVDPEGQGSRYAASKKGEPSMPHLTHTNIRVFADAMERLGDFLERLDSGFVAMQGIKNEMQAEH
jgi:hypothetical protein